MHATLVVKIETHMALHPPFPPCQISSPYFLLMSSTIQLSHEGDVCLDQPVAASTSTVLLLYLEMQAEEKCAAH